MTKKPDILYLTMDDFSYLLCAICSTIGDVFPEKADAIAHQFHQLAEDGRLTPDASAALHDLAWTSKRDCRTEETVRGRR